MLSQLCLFFCLFLGTGIYATAQQQELLLTGVYNGKNLYVQNPISTNLKDYCTREVYVNGTLIFENPRTSAYIINLAHLAPKAPIEVRILYSEGCMPKIINPQVVRVPTGFKYLAVNIDSSAVSWTTNKQQKGGKFFVEKWYGEQWQAIGTAAVESDRARYTLPVSHHSGTNRYRIKFLQDDGDMYYSNVQDHNASIAPITFTPTRVSDKIFLSRDTDYVVTDTGGNQLMKGTGKEIFVGNLSSGVYYLRIDNRSEKFFKK